MSDAAEIEQLISSDKWFHAIDFGKHGISPGRFDKSRPSNYTLFGVLRFLETIALRGMECLDVGTMDGLVAFAMKQAGAAHVTATDMAERASFIAGRSALALDVDYVVPVRIDEFAAQPDANPFDLIVCAGVLYHVFEPLSTLVLCREMLKLDGLFIFETQYLSAEPRALISFSPADRERGSVHANTFFRPSYSALVGMLEVAGFEVVSSIAIGSRITMLARAGKPGEIRCSTPMVRQIHEHYGQYRNYGDRIDYNELRAQRARSTIHYEGPADAHYFIHGSRFRTRFALQPAFAVEYGHRLRLAASEFYSQLRTSWARRRWLPAFDTQRTG